MHSVTSFSGLNKLYDYPTPRSVPTGAKRSSSYRCTVCANIMSGKLYRSQDGRCDECKSARDNQIEAGFMGRRTDAPIILRKEAGAQLGRLATVHDNARCGECRATIKFCKCNASVKYLFNRKEWIQR